MIQFNKTALSFNAHRFRAIQWEIFLKVKYYVKNKLYLLYLRTDFMLGVPEELKVVVRKSLRLFN